MGLYFVFGYMENVLNEDGSFLFIPAVTDTVILRSGSPCKLNDSKKMNHMMLLSEERPRRAFMIPFDHVVYSPIEQGRIMAKIVNQPIDPLETVRRYVENNKMIISANCYQFVCKLVFEIDDAKGYGEYEDGKPGLIVMVNGEDFIKIGGIVLNKVVFINLK